MLLRILLVGLSLLPNAWAAIDAFEFETRAQELQYRGLIEELRCPKCQNQNIADSNAPLAEDLRQKVYEMVSAGQSDAEIENYMVQRYGDFVTYRPPLKPITWVLWFGPLSAVIIAGLFLMIWIRRRGTGSMTAALSENERARLASVLAESRETSAKPPKEAL